MSSPSEGTDGQNYEPIAPNEWQPENFVSDPNTKVLKVTYREKYGEQLTIYCMAFFRNDKISQYKAIAPWISGSVLIERENITSLDIEEVDKTSMPATGK